MKSVEFVYFNKNSHQLYSAEAELNCGILRNYLENSGVEQEQYFCDMLPNVLDIVDDIASSYMDYVCFYIVEQNKEFSLTVAESLVSSGEDMDIVFICQGDVTISTEIGQVIRAEQAIDELSKLLEIPEEGLKERDFGSLKAYETNLFPLKACSDMGIIMNQYVPVLNGDYVSSVEDIMSELLYVSKFMAKDNQIILRTDDISAHPQVDQLLRELKTLDIKQKLCVKTVRQNQSSNGLKQLNKLNIPVVLEEQQYSDQALLNGLQSFYTGYYPDNIVDGNVKHIQVDKAEIQPELLEKLANHNAANSAIYGTGSNDKKSYEEIKADAKQAGFLLTNYLSFEEIESTTDVSVHINNRKDAYQFKKEAYSNYGGDETNNCFVSLNSLEDFNCYINDIKKYNETGFIHNDRMWKPNIIDQCRWSFDGMCSLSKLLRYRVTDEKIYPCHECSVSIGSADSLYFELQKNARIHIDKQQTVLECNECPKKMECVKCVMLPDFLSPEKYCQLMKSDLNMISFAKQMFIVKYLFEMARIDLLSSHKVQDLLFVTKESNLEVDESLGKGTNNYMDDYILLIKIKSQQPAYIGFNLKNKKALSLNVNIFVLCELFYKGLEIEEMIEYLMTKYELEKQQASKIIKDGIGILKNYKFIKSGVLQDVL